MNSQRGFFFRAWEWPEEPENGFFERDFMFCDQKGPSAFVIASLSQHIERNGRKKEKTFR